MSKYTIGVDFGTESGRAVLVDVTNGREVATAVYPYSHGVIDEKLLDTNIRLEPDWALALILLPAPCCQQKQMELRYLICWNIALIRTPG
jgi:ribulose kinase